MSVQILKRSGRLEAFDARKIEKRIGRIIATFGFAGVDWKKLVDLVSDGICERQPSSDLDDMLAGMAARFVEENLEYDALAVVVSVLNLRKEVGDSFYESMKKLYSDGQLAEAFWNDVDRLEKECDISQQMNLHRNNTLTFFGLETLKKMFLLKIGGKHAECPQFMFLRDAIFLHGSDFVRVMETYDALSLKFYIHGTPTMCNSGKTKSQLASCYLMTLSSTNGTDEFMDLVSKCVSVCENTGGVGLNLSRMSKTKFVSAVKLIDSALNFVNSVGGDSRRVGGIAVYIEPWHACVLDFLRLKEKSGSDEMRARSLFYGLWIPDLFMKRVYANETWSLFDPDKIDASDLIANHGREFDILYKQWEKDESKVFAVKKAREIFEAILKSNVEIGGPYLLYKDTCNRYNMQDYLGTLVTSNLCTEILEFCAYDYPAVCNLASIALPKFVKRVGSSWLALPPPPPSDAKTDLKIEKRKRKAVRFAPTTSSSRLPRSPTPTPIPSKQSKQSPLRPLSLRQISRNADGRNERNADENNEYEVETKENSKDEEENKKARDEDEKKQKNETMIEAAEEMTEAAEEATEEAAAAEEEEEVTAVDAEVDAAAAAVELLSLQANASSASVGSDGYSYGDINNRINDIYSTYGTIYTVDADVPAQPVTATSSSVSSSFPSLVYSPPPRQFYFDFNELAHIVRLVTRNLNKVIDKQFNNTPADGDPMQLSNYHNRPIGIGVQGLADVFAKLELPFESEEARILNVQIFETIYYAALEMSCELSKNDGPFKNFSASKYNSGILHPDLFRDVETSKFTFENGRISENEWSRLRRDVKTHGVRNSLLTAVMPTATTSQILGNNESVEPYTYNLYARRTQVGEYKIINRNLFKKLDRKKCWKEDVKSQILADKGSVKNLPNEVLNRKGKNVFKTNWEISQKALIQMAIDRTPYVDQSQSLNIHIEKPTMEQLFNLHFFTWSSSLKTGMYYLRTNPAVKSADFVNPNYNMCGAMCAACDA